MNKNRTNINKSGFVHESSYRGEKDEWLTPPEIIKSLGEFDLDPCSPINRPWDTAKKHYNINDDGLLCDWYQDRVWCNPPYGPQTCEWLNKMRRHNNGVALTFARTETKMFFNCVWDCAKAVLFLRGRLRFYNVSGAQGGPAAAPSVLIAYGENNIEPLKNSGLNGKFILL